MSSSVSDLPHPALAETAFEVGEHRSCGKQVFYWSTQWNMKINSFMKRWGRVSWNLSPIIFQEKQPSEKYMEVHKNSMEVAQRKSLNFIILIPYSHL